ncbi:MAG: FAD-dependent oxidoreductase [Desulfobacterales bacterium]|jgi:2,4-dienoyl-CoA reductase-like NADH-dependent reductase (Old Yellow Enzyme family)/thioredoxin reductase|nr:FAD-dependent oxidoreductase [Desulfobacterales bacterium]
MSILKHLFSPITIGPMTARNRLLMSAMSINFGVDDHNYVTEQLTQYFVARARGGVGMMLVGGGAVRADGIEAPDLPGLWDDGCVPALQKMTSAVRPLGARFGVQLMHGGRQCMHADKVAPSAIPAPALAKGIPRALAVSEIHELVQAFAASAKRCRAGGFDFLEIHAAHGYLIGQFLSPNANHRTDAYGGSFENRIRFLLEVFRAVQQAAGDKMPVGVRMNGEDYIQDGWTLDDARALAVILEREGADYLHVSAGVYGGSELTIPPMYSPHGCFAHLAEAVKKVVSIPVIAVGRIKHAEMANRLIKEGKADMVAMGRSFLADPDFPAKSMAGEFGRIRPCIGCCLGCIHSVFQQEPGACVVNPDVGREYRLTETVPVKRAKKILVLGSGPAGLAAARMLALRGHEVMLFEERGHLGGQARIASFSPGRGEIMDIVTFFIKELERLNVQICLNVSLSAERISALQPEEVVVATGALPEMPMIKGLFQTQMTLHLVTDILEGRAGAGDRIIVLGGGQAGLMAADFLAEKGKEVVVLNRKRHFAEELSANDRYYLRNRLKQNAVKLFKQASITAFLADGVRFRSAGEDIQLNGFDTVVIAEKMSAIRKPLERFKGMGMPVHVIGDAKSPRILMHAISEAEALGRSL